MHMRPPRQFSAVGAIFCVLIATSCSLEEESSMHVHVTRIAFSNPTELSERSEYLIRGTVISAPSRVVIRKPLAYMVSEVQVDKIIAQREDVETELDAGKMITVGVSVLDPSAGNDIGNLAELAIALPSADEALAKGDNVLLFLVETPHSDSAGPNYEAIGHGIVHDDDRVAWKGFSGSLAGTSSDLSIVIHTDVLTKFDQPKPADEADPVEILEVPPEGRPPMSRDIVDN